jgi:hypothetical protein
MEEKKNKFSFVPQEAQERELTIRDLRLLEESAIKPGLSVGYNPYDSDKPKVPTAMAPRPDLRKLSEWIKLQKQVDALKKEDEAPEQQNAANPQS